MSCFSFSASLCFSPRARGRAVPMKEGGRAVRQTWFPAPSYCPLGTGIWKESLDLHYVSDDNQSHRHEHHNFQCHKNYIEVTRGAVSPVILSNYPNGRFLLI